LRVTIAQLDSIVGDVRRNTEKFIRVLEESRAQAPDLVVFPEMYLVGYPPILSPYPVLDETLHYYVEEGWSAERIISRGLDPEMIRWVIRTGDRNEFKRRQAAPGLRVTTKAFGVGRRMPIAARLEQ